MRIFIVVHRW